MKDAIRRHRSKSREKRTGVIPRSITIVNEVNNELSTKDLDEPKRKKKKKKKCKKEKFKEKSQIEILRENLINESMMAIERRKTSDTVSNRSIKSRKAVDIGDSDQEPLENKSSRSTKSKRSVSTTKSSRSSNSIGSDYSLKGQKKKKTSKMSSVQASRIRRRVRVVTLGLLIT